MYRWTGVSDKLYSYEYWYENGAVLLQDTCDILHFWNNDYSGAIYWEVTSYNLEHIYQITGCHFQ